MMTTENIEIDIARDVTSRLFAGVMAKSTAPTLMELAHALGLACGKRGFVSNEASYRRICEHVVADIAERQKAADELNQTLIESTAELVEMRRKRAGQAP
jgi:hypothetical protein